MYGTHKDAEKFVLAAVTRDGDADNLAELRRLVEEAGGVVAGVVTQNRQSPHPTRYFGKGKTDFLREEIKRTEADGVVCDDELFPAQLRNMEEALGCQVLDRTSVILDIFARRAVSAAGKTQVEMAQLKYRLARLSGRGAELSRLGGGIGTRGPGEKKLESDRRHIRERLTQLNEELKDITRQRELLRKARKYSVVSLVGYTNAGKSTLMNAITNAGVTSEDKLFATLDTTSRAVKLPEGGEALFTDTVGFISKLPHHLIQAFRATLDELRQADVLLHVADASAPSRGEQMAVVRKTLDDIGVTGIPIITVYNKSDIAPSDFTPSDSPAGEAVRVSAINGDGISGLLSRVENILRKGKKIAVLIPYSEGRFVRMIHDHCEILEEKHLDTGTYIQAYLDNETAGRVSQFEVTA